MLYASNPTRIFAVAALIAFALLFVVLDGAGRWAVRVAPPRGCVPVLLPPKLEQRVGIGHLYVRLEERP